ncbi:hypothetical protein DL96DRAFT_1708701 [Flagelloscypha sp. PMI_526]|nr:hypothetical protein DL96DRAFT_1708701 [Flagelloscypha sp. PMI_526]
MASSGLDVPQEIWNEIAIYLTSRELSRLSTLCKTFAALNATRLKKPTLFLPTGTSYFVGTFLLSDNDWRTVAYNISKKFRVRIDSGGAPCTKNIIFYEPRLPTSGPQPTVFANIGRFIGSRIQQTFTTRGLSSVYKQYTAVDSISILRDSHSNIELPGCFRYLNMPAFWSAFSANLRQLSISIVRASGLKHILPARGTTLLPKLEIVRFAYLDRYAGHDSPVSYLRHMASLYINDTLKEIEVHFVYPLNASYGPLIAEIILPSTHTFPQLWKLSVTTEWGGAFHPSQNAVVASFIQRHSITLRSIKVHKFDKAIQILCDRPYFFANGAKFSFACRTKLDLQGSSFSNISNDLVDLELAFQYDDIPSLSICPNLRRLCVRTADLRVNSLEHVADLFPRLVSLKIMYREAWRFPTTIHSMVLCSSWVLSPLLTALARSSVLDSWKLKDIAIYPGGGRLPIPPDFSLMRKVAKLIPSVESFLGRGDMIEEPEPWEHVWVWRKNVYIDPLMNGI